MILDCVIHTKSSLYRLINLLLIKVIANNNITQYTMNICYHPGAEFINFVLFIG